MNDNKNMNIVTSFKGLGSSMFNDRLSSNNFDPSQIGKKVYKPTSEKLKTNVESKVPIKSFDPSQIGKREYKPTSNNNIGTVSSLSRETMVNDNAAYSYDNNIGSKNYNMSTVKTLEKKNIYSSIMSNSNSTTVDNNSMEITDKDIENFINYINRTASGENISITGEEARKYLAIAEVFKDYNVNIVPDVNNNSILNDLLLNDTIEITDKDVDNYIDFVKKSNNGENPSITESDTLKYMIIQNIFNGNDLSSIPNVKVSNSALKKIESYSVIEITDKDVTDYIDLLKNPSEKKINQLTDEQKNKYGLIGAILNGNVEVFSYVKISDDNLRKLQKTYKELQGQQKNNQVQTQVPQKQYNYVSESIPVASGGKPTGMDVDKMRNIMKGINDKIEEELLIINRILDDISQLKPSYYEKGSYGKLNDICNDYIYNIILALNQQKKTLSSYINGQVTTFDTMNNSIARLFDGL